MSGLLSASELDQISTTDTEPSESDSEETSAEDPLAGSMSASSSTGKLLLTSDYNFKSVHFNGGTSVSENSVIIVHLMCWLYMSS